MDKLDLPDIAQTLDYTCGAACFESMYQYFFQRSQGEMFFAERLKTLDLGCTPPEHILPLAETYGLRGEFKVSASFEDLIESFSKKNVIFVTWWDEDAGHYSLIKNIEPEHIVLMDPWTARDSMENRLTIESFIFNWNLRGR